MLWALVPARLGSSVKTRLASALTAEQRAGLARAMLSDVLAALAQVPRLAGVAVVAGDDDVAALASGIGGTVVRETAPGGLNAAVALGVERCTALGASGVVVVMGDLPLVTSDEIEQVVARLPERGVVLVPSRDGTGTNVLALRPPSLLAPTCFGPGSLALHRSATDALGIRTSLCMLRGAALDVDTVDDLACLLRSDAAGPATRAWLSAHGDRAPTGRA